ADFFDPFTGQGIYAALRGAELAADCLIPALARGATSTISVTMLEPYVRARRREFAGKWALERLIGLGVGWPALAERVVGRLARRFAAEHPDRFDGVGYTENEDGLPLLDGVLATIACEKHGETPAGDHTVFLGIVTGGSVTDRTPLLYYRGGYASLSSG